MTRQYLISTDTGGTFVDLVICDERGEYAYTKVPATPHHPPEGILSGIAELAKWADTDLSTLLADAQMIFNGTTVTTNAMLEGKGARTGLLITKGFEDTLVIARVLGRTAGLEEDRLLDYRHTDPPPPVIPRAWVKGVTERIDADGEVVVPLNLEEARQAVRDLMAAGIEALAVCFLWSFRNPRHEQQVAHMVRTEFPQLHVVASSELVPILREFERANTTAVNAYLRPIFHRYADGLQSRLSAAGYGREPLIMQSIGGLAPAAEIKETPITTLLSGPVGGVMASAKLGEMLGRTHLITTDMGGTSFDVGLVVASQPLKTPMTLIGRQMVAIPTVDIVTVGAGGGSVAWLNEVGALQVGPESMGANPGPACYGKGGTLPTVTDADVVLGYIDPDFFLGGRMRIQRELAEAAIRRKVADPTGMDVVEAAAAVYQIVNARMADLIRMATVERGYDPREFSMLAYGGCGPTHCTGYGPEIGIREVIVPELATVFSAFGIGQSDIRHSYVHSFPFVLRDERGCIDVSRLPDIQAIVQSLTEKAQQQLQREKLTAHQAVFHYSADLRYFNQIHELVVGLQVQAGCQEQTLFRLVEDFKRAYEQKYGHGASSPVTVIELLNLRLEVIVPTGHRMQLKSHPLAGRDPAAAQVGEKPFYSFAEKDFVKVPVFQAERLRPGHEVQGPALLVSFGTTLPLHEGQMLRVDPYRNFILTFASRA
ncbi:MAG: hydantoinase/oxoprolinase family protein [Alicyclobacillus sp.]|nr:hydantoinase/oxoprolinase family protein [Alicyclobacillus sp.]